MQYESLEALARNLIVKYKSKYNIKSKTYFLLQLNKMDHRT